MQRLLYTLLNTPEAATRINEFRRPCYEHVKSAVSNFLAQNAPSSSAAWLYHAFEEARSIC